MFPLLMDQKEKNRIKEKLGEESVPKSIPIEFIEQFSDQIKKNHDQTINELAERGGLHPRELCAAMYGVPLNTYFGRVKEQLSDEQTIFSLNMIFLKLKDFKSKK